MGKKTGIGRSSVQARSAVAQAKSAPLAGFRELDEWDGWEAEISDLSADLR
jgi:hypothetical protein